MWDLKNNKMIGSEKDSLLLSFLYNTFLGRIILWVLTRKFITNIGAIYMKSPLSRLKIKRFIKNNNIDMDEYVNEKYKCFNDFFMRRIKPDKRKIEDGLFSICDSKLSVYEINDDLSFDIKHSKYTVSELVGEEVDKKYKYALVFRLCVDDYHHYVFPDNGKIIKSKYINGILHTVRPIALKKNKVFVENAREVSFLECDNLGSVIYVEVGALMVGKIVNEKIKSFKRADEKGHFEFGGSTIVMLLEDKVKVNDLFIENTKKGIETIVKLGNKLD